MFVETYILTFVQPCFSLGGPPPTTSATRPVEGGFEKVKVILYLIFSETVNVDQVNCGKVNYWYLDLKSIPTPYDYRRSSLARSQSAFWRTAVPYQRWSCNTTTRQIFYLKLSWSCRTCTLDRFTNDQIKIHVALCWFLVLGIIEIIVKCVCPKMFPSLRIRNPPCLHCNYNAQCVFCKVYFSAQPNKLRPILKFKKCYPIEHIFVPACSSARKIRFFKF